MAQPICEPEATPESPPPKPTVLIVDDEVGPRESLRMILCATHDVLVADSGNEALDILRSTDVDLVTVDLNMPGMKGNDLVRSVRDEFPDVGVIVITGCASVETAVEGIRYGVSDYLTKPFDVVQVTGAVTRCLGQMQSRQRLVSFLEGIGKVLGRHRSAGDILRELDTNEELQARLRSVLEEPALAGSGPRNISAVAQSMEFLEVLAETIETRDVYLLGHARRVAYYASLLGERLCLARDQREQIRVAAFMHDIGKVGVPSDVLARRGRLDEESREEILKHAEIGERLTRPLGFPEAVGSIVRHHHERWDGAGYPDGSKGEDIPLAARIIAVADAFDAMTCDKPYQAARSEEAAVAELRKEAGCQFDPDLVEVFAEIVETGITLEAAAADGGEGSDR